MALFLHIEEYQHEVPATYPLLGEPVAAQKVEITTSTPSAAFNAATTWVLLTAQRDCQIEFGTNPTADGDSWYLPANVPRGYPVERGQSWKVAVVTVVA